MGRLSGLLVDWPDSVSDIMNIEVGLDWNGYRSGNGEKVGSASASNSTSSGSTRIENLAEDRCEEDPVIDDLDDLRDNIVVDNL